MKNHEGGGGMYSTADDLLKWSLFFQHMLTKDTVLKNALQPFVIVGWNTNHLFMRMVFDARM